MKDLIPQDPAPWAAKILALKDAVPFQAFSIEMVSGDTYPVSRPEYVAVTADGECARLNGPEGLRAVLALDWVVEIEVGGEVGAPPRPPRYAAKLRALQESGPHGPLVMTMQDGRRFPLAGPHQFLLAPNGRSVAACEQGGGLAVLATSEITDLVLDAGGTGITIVPRSGNFVPDLCRGGVGRGPVPRGRPRPAAPAVWPRHGLPGSSPVTEAGPAFGRPARGRPASIGSARSPTADDRPHHTPVVPRGLRRGRGTRHGGGCLPRGRRPA